MKHLNSEKLEFHYNATVADLADIEQRILQNSSSENRLRDLLEEIYSMKFKVSFELFKRQWSGRDDTYQYRADVLEFLNNAFCDVDVEDFLTSAESAWFNTLPDRFQIYRGCAASRVDGVSWSTDQSTAVEFAKGHRGKPNLEPVVLSGKVYKSQVFVRVKR